MGTQAKSRFFLIAVIAIAVGSAVFYIARKVVHHIQARKSDTFQLQVTIGDTSGGYLLLAPYVPTQHRYSTLIIIGLRGNIITEKRVEGIVSDFRQWYIDGHICYSYAVYNPNNDPGDFIHGSMAHAVILDSALNEIKQVHLMSHDSVVANETNGIDHHDFMMLGDDHFITISSYVKTVSNIPSGLSPAAHVRVIAPIIQEIKHDTVAWQWDGSRFPEFYAISTKGNKFSDSANVQDYMHVNSITIDPKDSNLVVSFHNTNQVVKLNRQTGDIIWRLGGSNSDFPLTPGQVFLRQHHPTFADSGRTLMLLDNGDSILRPQSRVLEFRLDERKKKVTYFKAYNIPEPFAESKGSVQLVNNNYLICGGSANYLLEVSRETGDKRMEMHYNQTSFRAYYVKDVPGMKH